MIHMLSRGEHSDYTVCSLWEGPEADLQQLFINFVKSKIGPKPTPDGTGRYNSPKWQQYLDEHLKWEDRFLDEQMEAKFEEHLASLGYRKLEYKEHELSYDWRKQ